MCNLDAIMLIRYLIIFGIVLAIEIYFLMGVRTFVQDFSQNKRNAILYTAYALVAINVILGITGMFYPQPNWNSFFRFLSMALVIITFCKFFGVIFLIIDDIIRLFRWIFSLFQNNSAEVAEGTNKISRLKFLSQVAMGITVIPAIGFIYGMVRGAYKYRVHKVTVPSPNLPEAFNGFKIVQLSDIHTGSFVNTSALSRAFDIVMQQGADMILFTGDLVNNEARETEGFEDIYARLKAPHGVYSVLGNHDYGDYKNDWANGEKKKNMERLKNVQAAAGWRLLLNEHVPIEKNGQTIGLLGIENWGAKMHFTKYGRMDLAYEGAEKYPFKILMSHDPSHWEVEVREKYSDVDLTLSGHTHGMQLGIEIPGVKWSPSQWFYKQWAGLYKQENQFLYVNRGLGFLGYPGRLGIWPEITVIELKRV